MRTNSKIRYGVMALAAALLLFLAWLLFFRRTGSSEEVAGVPTPGNGANGTGANVVQVAAPQGMVAQAITSIPDRSIVTPGMFKMVRLPDGASTDNYFTDNTAINGFITSRTIPAGGRLQRADLLGHITQIGVAGAVRPGLRAQVVPIANKATLHDLIHVGDYVDVIASFDQEEARTIVQNVRVLAVDIYGADFPDQVRIAARGQGRAQLPNVAGAPTPTPSPTPANNAPPPALEAAVTLEVTPQQAVALALSQAAASPLDLILRPRPTVTEVVIGASGTPGAPGVVPVVGVVRRSLAPTAYRVKRGNQASNNNRSSDSSKLVSNLSKSYDNLTKNVEKTIKQQVSGPAPKFDPPTIPPADINGSTTTINDTPPPPQTYKIPIYGDGKVMREDEVLKPGS